MKRLNKHEKAKKLLAELKQKEASNGSKSTFLGQGITGEKITGKRKWN